MSHHYHYHHHSVEHDERKLAMLAARHNLLVPGGPSRQASGLSVQSGGSGAHTPAMTGSGTSTPASYSSKGIPKSSSVAHRLMHIFDATKHAYFDASVTVHGLGDVLVEGDFEAHWKFKTRKPVQSAIHPKPSLPNLKLQQKPSAPSSTNASTPSLSSLDSGPSTAMAPSARSRAPTLSITPVSSSHAGGLPRSVTTPLSIDTPIIRTPVPRAVSGKDKKSSDPTPLRHSIQPRTESSTSMSRTSSASSSKIVTAEPEPIVQAEVSPSSTSNDADRRGSGSGSAESASRSSGERPSSSPSSSISVSVPNRSQPSLHASSPLSAVKRSPAGYSPLSASSSLSFLSVPNPRPYVVPPTRSGTGPSASIIMDRVPSRPTLNRDPTARTISTVDEGDPESQDPSRSSSLIAQIARPLRRRSRSSTHVQTQGHKGTDKPRLERSDSWHHIHRHAHHSSSHRKGVIPRKRCKFSSVTWDYELEHKVSIPLSSTYEEPDPTLAGQSRQTAASRRPRPVLSKGEAVLQLSVYTYAATHEEEIDQDRQPAGRKLGSIHSGQSSAKLSQSAKAPRELYGKMQIDLAQFAGRGKVTRRFLFDERPDNSTIKVTVNLKYIGGEKSWLPPALQGHHVVSMSGFSGDSSQIRDNPMVRTRSDSSSTSDTSYLSLATNPSHPGLASSTSLLKLTRTRSQNALTPSPASGGPPGAPTHVGQLLQPPEITCAEWAAPCPRRPKLSSRHLVQGPLADWREYADPWQMPAATGQTLGIEHGSSPYFSRSGPSSPTTINHLLSPGLESPTTPIARLDGAYRYCPSPFGPNSTLTAPGQMTGFRGISPSPSPRPQRLSSKHFFRGGKDAADTGRLHHSSGLNALSPDVLVEAVFNPVAATDEGPLTFVVDCSEDDVDVSRVPKEEDVIERAMMQSSRDSDSTSGAPGRTSAEMPRRSAPAADTAPRKGAPPATPDLHAGAAHGDNEILITPPHRIGGWTKMKQRAQQERERKERETQRAANQATAAT